MEEFWNEFCIWAESSIFNWYENWNERNAQG